MKEKQCKECIYFKEGDTYLEYIVPPYCVKKEIDLVVGSKACEEFREVGE